MNWWHFEKSPIHVEKCWKYFGPLEKSPIHVECLHIYSVQAFYMDWWLFWKVANPCRMLAQNPYFWNVTNPCRMLAHYICASILHGLVTFQVVQNIFHIFPHGLVTFQKVTNSCRMLAHNRKHANYLIFRSKSNFYFVLLSLTCTRCWMCLVEKSLFCFWWTFGRCGKRGPKLLCPLCWSRLYIHSR